MSRRHDGRTVLVGDVQGCRDELARLLDEVRFGAGDRLVLVGDLVARGPDSRGVVELAREVSALAVRGNHEHRILEARLAGKQDGLGKDHARVLASLEPGDLAWLEALPLWLGLPEHGARVVHAGLDPAASFGEQTVETLLHVRTARTGRDGGREVLWGELYEGPVHVVFGHHARAGLQLHPFATGLDTGCVYGGTLTALVLDPGEPVPRDVDARRGRIVSVPAARVWFDPHGP